MIDISEAVFSSEGYPVLALVEGAVVRFVIQIQPDVGDGGVNSWQAEFTVDGTKSPRDVIQIATFVGEAPRIIQHPKRQNVLEGQALHINVGVEGQGEMTYQWWKDDEPIPGAVRSEFNIPTADATHSGIYRVEVAGLFGSVTSDPAVVEVSVVQHEALRIVAQPEARLVPEYSEVIQNVEVVGESPFTYQWVRDDDPICGETASVLRFPSIRYHQRAFYSVIVTDARGNQVSSDKVVVDVEPSDLTEELVFDNNNIGAVFNQPTAATAFDLAEPLLLNRIETYHWNYGSGQSLGAISLENQLGEVFGPWETLGRCGQGGVLNAYWTAFPQVELPAGQYTVIDSDPATWSHNSESGGSGFVTLSGVWLGESPIVDSGLVDVTGIEGEWVQAGDASWFVQSAVTNDGGTALQSGLIDHEGESRIDVTLQGPGQFSFAWKTSSEDSDPLSFYVDEAMIQEIRGETDWRVVTYPVRWGAHTLSWRYRKDSSVSVGSDAGWLDELEYLPLALFEVEDVLDQVTQPIEQTGSAPWFGQGGVRFEGLPTVQTGNINHGESSSLGFNVFGPGEIKFVWKISSEAADRLLFSDGARSLTSISGETGWMEQSFDLRWGLHELSWTYRKDGSVHSGQDAGWLSKVLYTPVPVTELGRATDNENLVWTSSEERPWFGQASESLTGGFSAQSGNIGDGQVSDLRTTVTGPGTLLFRWSSSSENADRTHFLIDDGIVNTIAGEVAWQPLAYAIDAGSHTLTWRYGKDSSISMGRDAAWVDQVEWSQTPVLGLDTILPIDDGNNKSMSHLRSSTWRIFLFNVTGTTEGSLWGTGEFTDDSVLGKAAVHSGVLGVGETGVVKVTMLPGRESYIGSGKNGVVSQAYGSWPASYRVESLPVGSKPAPLIEIRLVQPGMVEVSWESFSNDWRLQSSATLSGPFSWSLVEGEPASDGPRRSIKIPVEADAQYFQLTR